MALHTNTVRLDLNFKKTHAWYYTSLEIFVACLRALGKVMTSTSLMESKHTCYKLVMGLSTRAYNVNALDMCHMRHQLECVFHL